MLLGRSLYGGALYPRQVTAAGAVACGATTSAKAIAAFRDGSGTFATATVATGAGVRNVLPVPAVGQGVAAVSAKAFAQFFLAVAPVGAAAVQGLARADFFALGDLPATVTCTGRIIRTIRVLIPSNAKCQAEIEPEAAIYALADPEAALCYSNPFGTYWYVGTGSTEPTASLAATAQKVRAASGVALCAASIFATAQADTHGLGAAEPVAALTSDPLLTVAGVRYWDAHGESVAQAEGSADEYIYAVALSVGFCNPNGRAQAQRAARGAAACNARATGFIEIVLPEYGQVFIDTAALGAANAHFAALGKSRVTAIGASAARAASEAKAAGESRASAGVASNVVWLTANGTVNGQSGATASAHRGIYAGGTCPQAAGAAAAGRKQAAASVASNGLAAASGSGIFHPKVLCEGSATAVANLAALYRLAQRAAGVATAGALPVGTNRVNDAGQRLSSRAIGVGAERRFISITEPPRLIAVAGAARRLAA